jgi:hypothetical protein
VGSSADVEWFVRAVLEGHRARIKTGKGDEPLTIDLTEVPAAVRDAIKDQGDIDELKVKFALPVGEGVLHLHRTQPLVEGLAGHVLDTALDPLLAGKSLARRAGVVRTRRLETRTIAMLLRLRFHLIAKRGDEERALLAEDWQFVAFRGSTQSPEWLPTNEAEGLLTVQPDANIAPDLARLHLSKAIDSLPGIEAELNALANERGKTLLEAHRRLRKATRTTGTSQRIEPKLPVDILGIYLYLPVQ